MYIMCYINNQFRSKVLDPHKIIFNRDFDHVFCIVFNILIVYLQSPSTVSLKPMSCHRQVWKTDHLRLKREEDAEKHQTLVSNILLISAMIRYNWSLPIYSRQICRSVLYVCPNDMFFFNIADAFIQFYNQHDLEIDCCLSKWHRFEDTDLPVV